MLIVTARNVSGLAPVSDYRVEVMIGCHMLWAGDVRRHRRADGWPALLRRIAAEARKSGRSAPATGRPEIRTKKGGGDGR